MSSQKLFCASCALANQKKKGHIDPSGKYQSKYGLVDQIGSLIPAVPIDLTKLQDIQSFWGYTSVPSSGCEWWSSLPSYFQEDTVSKGQYAIVHNSTGSRSIAYKNAAGKTIVTMRICSEEQINSMSHGSFKGYRSRIFDWSEAVHSCGTPEAIRTIDFLMNACKRSKTLRSRNNNPPLC